MAYLNLRERCIEAKIAFIEHPLDASRHAGFERLRQAARDARGGCVATLSTDTDAELALVWEPADAARFRDCKVAVKVVAPPRVQGGSAFDDLVRGADCVVVSLDDRPGAAARNADTLRGLGEALLRAPQVSLPVVLHVDGSDEPSALSPDAVRAALDTAALTRVIASPAADASALGPLEAALGAVLSALAESDDARAEGPTPDPAHPLLEALRGVLRATVREHVVELTALLSQRFEGSFSRVEASLARAEAIATGVRQELATVELEGSARQEDLRVDLERISHAIAEAGGRRMEDAARLERSLARVEAHVAAVEARTVDLQAEVDRASRLAEGHGAAAELSELLQEANVRLQGLVIAVAGGATKQDVAALSGRMIAVRDDLESDLSRSMDAHALGAREGVAAVAGVIARSIDAVAGEVRALDVGPRVDDVGAVVEELARRTERMSDELKTTNAGVRALGPILAGVGSATTGGVERIDASVRDLGADLTERLAAADERAAALEARVAEIVEELKKPKRGWFARP